MPEDAPDVKLRATRGYGAEVILYERARIHRQEFGQEIAEKRGLTIIPPYDNKYAIGGARDDGERVN